jgi:hypothetical protein
VDADLRGAEHSRIEGYTVAAYSELVLADAAARYAAVGPGPAD